MNVSGHVGHETIFSRMLTIACCLVVLYPGSGLGLGLDSVSGWLVVVVVVLLPFVVDYLAYESL